MTPDVKRLIDFYWSACEQWSRLGNDMGRIALYHLTVNPLAMSDSMQQALKALSDFVEAYQVLPDILNTNNLMMRKDGTLGGTLLEKSSGRDALDASVLNAAAKVKKISTELPANFPEHGYDVEATFLIE